jgi:ABC-type antimicrobial peptide transport system permease subunit
MIRKAIASIDSSVPVTEAMPLIDQVRGEYVDARVASAVVTSAAAIGLLLSAIGLYGVVAYEVGRRTREIGIRMALGAQPQQVLQLFIRQGLVVIFIGTAAGGVLALTTTRLLAAWLFGVGPFDSATFSLAVAILLALVLFASYIPARHATKVDPMVALRFE